MASWSNKAQALSDTAHAAQQERLRSPRAVHRSLDSRSSVPRNLEGRRLSDTSILRERMIAETDGR